MKLYEFSLAIGVILAVTMTGSAQAPRGKDLDKPLVIAKQGSFFVGGEKKTLWETTPDGRMGWDESFVRRDRPVYLADQVSRARSGFDASTINAVKAGTAPASELPYCKPATRLPGRCFASVPHTARRFPTANFPSKPPMSSTSR